MNQGPHTPILPEALTFAQAHDLLQAIRRGPTRFEDGLAAHCTLWLRWDVSGRDHNEYNAGRAARIIAKALNSQDAV
jgi:hypothetical protein